MCWKRSPIRKADDSVTDRKMTNTSDTVMIVSSVLMVECDWCICGLVVFVVKDVEEKVPFGKKKGGIK